MFDESNKNSPKHELEVVIETGMVTAPRTATRPANVYSSVYNLNQHIRAVRGCNQFSTKTVTTFSQISCFLTRRRRKCIHVLVCRSNGYDPIDLPGFSFATFCSQFYTLRPGHESAEAELDRGVLQCWSEAQRSGVVGR